MKEQDSLIGLQATVAELEHQKLEVERKLEQARREVQKGRAVIVAALEKTIAAYQAKMAKEITAILERLGMQTTVTVTLELIEGGRLTLKGFDLGDGAGGPSRTSTPLLKKDWERIFGLSWNEDEAAELKRFQTVKDGVVSRTVSKPMVRGRINGKMRAKSLPYRILATNPNFGTKSRDQQFYKLYLVV